MQSNESNSQRLAVTNRSGIHVKGDKLLVRPRTIETKTKSGLILVDETVDKESSADMFAFVVEIGPMCWKGKNAEAEPRCEVGDFIIHARYAGEFFTGNDGVKYRLLNARDVIATKEPTVEELERESEAMQPKVKEAA